MKPGAAAPARPRPRPWLPFALLAALPPACHVDDRMLSVQPEAIVLGTFESGTGADDPRFGAWQVHPVGNDPVTITSAIVHDGCNPSRWCLSLDWQVTDLADGAPSRAGVATGVTAAAPVDLSGLTRIVFDQQALHAGACAAANALTITLACDTLGTAFAATVPLAASWTTRSIDLDGLVENGAAAPGAVSRGACLAAVDSVTLDTGATLPDGGCASGTLVLDDVSIRGAP